MSSPTGESFSDGWLVRSILGAVLAQLVLGIARPALSYSAISLGADGLAIGLLAAVFAVVPMILALPLGTFAGRVKHIAIVPACSAMLLVAGCVVAAFASEIWMLGIASALLGAGSLGTALGLQGWVARSARPSQFNSAFGWMTASGSLGQAVGPMIAGVVVGPQQTTREGIVLAFVVAAVVGALLVVSMVSSAVRDDVGTGRARHSTWSVVRLPGVVRYTTTAAVVLTTVDMLTAYLPLVGEAYGIAPAGIGLLLGLRGISSMISRLLLGPLARRWNESTLIVVSSFGAAVAMLAIVIFPAFVPLAIAMVVGGFFLGIGQPLTLTVIVLALPLSARAQGIAFRMFGGHVAQAAVPLIAGPLSAVFGAGLVFLAQAAGLTAAAAWELAARSGGHEEAGD